MPKPAKIMLIEDDPLLVNLYDKAFKNAGYEVEIAFNGREGLEKLISGAQKPLLILSDVMMPEMDGLELLRKIKENPGLKDIPFVFLTNLSEEEDVDRGIELGAVTYLVKSQYTPKEIVGKIRELLAAYEEKVPEVLTEIKDIGPKKGT